MTDPDLPKPQRLRRFPGWLVASPWLYLWSSLLFVLVTFLDYLTGVDLSFSIFYLLSVGAVSWWGSGTSGLLFSFVSAVGWVLADAAAREEVRPAILLWNAAIRLSFFVIVSRSLNRIRSLLERERELSSTDYLTGATNTRGFYSALAQEVERTRRTGRPMTVAYVDLDNFKEVNDKLGHPAGDEVLRRIAGALSKSIRRVDVLCRLGGDEFALLLPETGGPEARTVLARAHDNVLATTRQDPFPVTVSIGAVAYSQPPDSVDDIVSRADRTMYHVKQRGKNRVLVVSNEE
ncbi:MAG TPA: GGDEF domain-containing protein [Vicinamibacteria bacterium]